MLWEIIVEYASGERIILHGLEPELVFKDAMETCQIALEIGVAVRLTMTYQEGPYE